MLVDFPRLSRTIFPHAEQKFMYSSMYMLGTVFGYPRMCTLKYLAHLSPAERQALEAVNELDIELYEWAKTHFGRRITMYSTFAECAVALLPVPGAALVLICLALRR